MLLCSQIPDVRERNYLLFPHVSSISPSQGSLAGGTHVTIQGGGFMPDTDVTLYSGAPCEEVIFNTYYEIICVIRPHPNEMVVDIEVSVDSVPTTCEALTCTFEYLRSLTPEITSVSPVSVEGTNTMFSLTGSGFGTDVSLVTVTIGHNPCTVSTSGFLDTSLNCTLSTGLPYGNHKLAVHKSPDGWSQFNPASLCNIFSNPVLASVSPTSGSTEGGTTVTMEGNGFTNPEEITVLIGGSECYIEELTPSQVICTTSEHVAQSDVSVTASLAVEENGTASTTDFAGNVTYSYDTMATPSVTIVNPYSGSGGDTVTITGHLFSTTPEENTVTIGGKIIVNHCLFSSHPLENVNKITADYYISFITSSC